MLQYMSLDPLYRKGDHNALTFAMTYAYTENFILPLSHDEVVHGKCSLVNKMPGNYDDKFNNLRTFFAYQMAHPGKKLNFMGNEFAQFIEWNYTQGLDWLLLGYEKHQKMQHFVRTLNHFYLDHRCFWENDSDWDGFRWLSCDDRDNSIVAFRRISRKGRSSSPCAISARCCGKTTACRCRRPGGTSPSSTLTIPRSAASISSPRLSTPCARRRANTPTAARSASRR